jgi:predicted Zn-dependent peptidase
MERMVKRIVLPNGLRVLLVPQPAALAATVLVLVEAGSEYETKATNGLSHFLEHMVFKGTKNRPNQGVIANELEAMGAKYNAFTTQEYTGYWAKVEAHKLPQALDIVSDLYLQPLFLAEEIEKERGVIIEEINMYEDTPMDKVHEIFAEAMYGDQPAGWSVAGRKEIIRSLTRDDFLRYRAARYVAPGTAVTIAGAFDEQAVVRQIRGAFGALKRSRRTRKPTTAVRLRGPVAETKFKESDQSHLVIGLHAFDAFDKRRYALQVLASVLGGGMSSRLFRRVREEMGAAYYVRAHTELSQDHGFMAVSAGVDVARVEPVARAILDELTRMAREPVPAAELKKTKDHMIGSTILSLETSDELAGYYGTQEIEGHRLQEPKALMRRVAAVTAAEVRAVARTLITDRRLVAALIGPYRDPNLLRAVLRLRDP